MKFSSKYWIKPRYSLRKRIHLKLTPLLLALPYKFPKIKTKYFEFLRSVSEHQFGNEDWRYTRKPDDYLINLLMVGYSDIYFIEDFDSLSKKIIKAKNKHSRSWLKDSEGKNINGWLTDAKERTFSRGSTRIGNFNFKKENNIDWFDYISLELKQISPSIITLSILAYPSEKLKNNFLKIVETPALNELEFTRFSIFKQVLSYSESSGNFVKTNEISDLFLELNKEVTMFLRNNIGLGLAMYHPLPAVEVLSINKSLTDLTEFNEPLKGLSKSFFKNIGLNYSSTVYREKDDCFFIYDVRRENDYEYVRRQLLASTSDFLSSKTKNIDNVDSELRYHLSYYLFELLPVLAILNSHKYLEKQILKMRNKLSGDLNKLKFRQKAFKNMMRINLLDFQLRRMNEEYNNDHIQSYLFHNLNDTKRKEVKSSEEVSMVKDFEFIIQRNSRLNEKQLKVLQNYFKELLEYRTMSINYFLGWAVFALSLFVLLPERYKEKIISFIWIYLIKLYLIVINLLISIKEVIF